MTRCRILLPLAALCLSLTAAPALAQGQPVPDAPPEIPAPEIDPPNMPLDGDPCAPDVAPGNGAVEQDDLTRQLDECDSVLTPPQTGDAGIEAPAPDPDPGTTPVVPPSDLPEQQQTPL